LGRFRPGPRALARRLPARVVPALLALGLLAGGCAYESAGTTTTTAADAAGGSPATGPATIVFEDQLVDGSAVVVRSVTLPADGFVVLAADAAGAPGEVIGVSELIGRGTVAGVAVPLFVPLAAEAVVHATLHVDMDEDGRFLYEPPDGFVDLPAVSGEGTMATDSAIVGLLAPLTPAAVTLEGQRTDGEAVVVAEVTLPAPGFVAVQGEEDGLPGAVLGLSELLAQGTHREVLVPLARTVAGPQTLFAVVYIDRDGDGLAGITSAESPDAVAQAFDGGPARAAAEITVVLIAPAAVEVDDQEGDGATVTVASASLPSPGFLEVRADDAGSPGPRLAVSGLLPAGASTRIQIELAQALGGDAVLWVRVRIDFDGDGVLGADDPIALTEEGRRAQASLSYSFVEEDE
jgi:hypothetical protein